jgi:hypothetical protein
MVLLDVGLFFLKLDRALVAQFGVLSLAIIELEFTP